MDIFDLFFGAGPAVTAIMKLGFMPEEKEFHELTPEQYRKYYEQNDDTNEKVYMLIPENRDWHEASESKEINVFTQSDIETLKKGWKIVERYCEKSGCSFSSDREMLAYAASRMPAVFSEGTMFEQAGKSSLKIASINEKETGNNA